MNLLAFRWGRMAVVDAKRVEAAVTHRVRPRGGDARACPPRPGPLVDRGRRRPDELRRLLEVRVPELIAYQDAAYAREYVEFVAQVAPPRMRASAPGRTGLAEAVARNLYKLMAYKDEYEVARLHLDAAAAGGARARGSASRSATRGICTRRCSARSGSRRRSSSAPGSAPAFRALLRAARAARHARSTPSATRRCGAWSARWSASTAARRGGAGAGSAPPPTTRRWRWPSCPT